MRFVRSQKGQASIFIGVMMLTFVIFFAFVVNLGTLVNAKINLQNAADLAAYAGASTQARLLNQISYLNYEMRRQYKKFIFRYYVLGNMAEEPFPNSANAGPTPYDWRPGGTGSTYDYKIPVVCVIFNSKDNFCKTGDLKSIVIPQEVAGGWDQINHALVTQLTELEQLREANCGTIGATNQLILYLWLYNADPTLASLKAASPANLARIIDKLVGYADGVGLVPREIILSQRIKTLANYLNTPALVVTPAKVNSLQGKSDPSNERAIQAFNSAYETLGTSIFSSDGITMTELLPSGSTASGASDQGNLSLIKLDPIEESFDTFALGFTLPKSSPPAGSNSTFSPSNCTPQFDYYSVSNVPVGYSKDPGTLTYYAVKLEADAKLLFYPSFFGNSTIHLTAYSAAQPFGSRIGPSGTQIASSLVTSWDGRGIPLSLFYNGGMGTSLTHFIPNVPMTSADDPIGWESQSILGKMLAQMGGSTPSPGDVDRADMAAMAPTLNETPMYNILNSFPDPFMDDFDDSNAATQTTSFWAPIVPASSGTSPADAIKGAIQQLFPQSGGANDYSTQVLATVDAYMNMLSAPGGSQDLDAPGETLNIAVLRNPTVFTPGTASTTGPIVVDPSFSASTASQIKTSWNQVQSGAGNSDPPYRQEGRIGYSVKFVSFDTLLNLGSKESATHGGSTKAGNLIQTDSDTQSDLSQVKH